MMRFGMDYGGTNVKAGVFTEAGEAVAFEQAPLRAFTSGDLLGNLVAHALRVGGGYDLSAGGLAIKGLVDTAAGCVVEDIGEGSLLAGRDLRAAFGEALGVPFAIENDARAYAWGEWRFGAGRGTSVMACMTLGTGLGSALVAHGAPYVGADPLGGILGGHVSIDRHGPECPCGQRGCAELFCSATALAARVRDAHPDLTGGDPLPAFFESVRAGDPSARATFDAYLDDLAIAVVNVIHAYGPERVVLGGGVMHSADLILPGLTERVHARAWTVPRRRVGLAAAALGNRAAALGAAFHPSLDSAAPLTDAVDAPARAFLPSDATAFPRGVFDPFPAFTPSEGRIERGYEPLAARIAEAVPEGLRVLALDGFHGVDWDELRERLEVALAARGVEATWWPMAGALADPDVIAARIEPFLGGNDPIFGTHFPLGPDVFFDAERLAALRIEAAVARGRGAGSLAVAYGPGAGLLELHDALWYADVPKDALQARARDGALTNLGTDERLPFGDFYKRAYFVEWPALNRLKRRLLLELDLFLDLQNPAAPTAMEGAAFRAALRELAESPFRPRPWFFPGPWGGQFMQDHMGLDPEAPNFAWSFELITPENGIVLEKGGARLECSFDCLMFQEHERVLGEAARQFKFEWPLRLDYLDTISGGNLSVQCHPRPDYIRRQFGETFTQDETYYISAAQEGARVYLGLEEDADPDAFRAALEESSRTGEPVDFERYVHSVPAKPHDLFLIPNGTVHCSGRGNLVLEISATPYIFTFKLYDYVRRDLEGKMRPINLERGWDNLRFERRAGWVRDNLVAEPRVLREGEGWKEEVLMERAEFFYNIHRLTVEGEAAYALEGRALAVNLVEGEAVEVVAANGRRQRLQYLESMVVPAAAERVTFASRGGGPSKLVLVFVRPGVGAALPLNDPIA